MISLHFTGSGWSLKQMTSIKEEAASNAEYDDVGEHDAYDISNSTRQEKDEFLL